MRWSDPVIWVAVFGVACGGEAAPAEEVVAPPVAREEVAEAPAEEPMYGDDGELLASDERVAGLRLPRRSELVISERRRHVYRTSAPLTKVQAYFGPRLHTMQVERSGTRLSYLEALPNDSPESTLRIDVEISSSSAGGVRFEIRERAPEMISPPSEQETIDRITRIIEEAD